MDTDVEYTEADTDLQKRILARAGITIPLDAIHDWSDHEKSWAEIWADNEYMAGKYQIFGKISTPNCVRPYLKR